MPGIFSRNVSSSPSAETVVRHSWNLIPCWVDKCFNIFVVFTSLHEMTVTSSFFSFALNWSQAGAKFALLLSYFLLCWKLHNSLQHNVDESLRRINNIGILNSSIMISWIIHLVLYAWNDTLWSGWPLFWIDVVSNLYGEYNNANNEWFSCSNWLKSEEKLRELQR